MTAFEVWAPAAQRVRVRLGDGAEHELTGEDGWWRIELPDVLAGADYSYLLDDGDTALPDPRAARLPAGVHGPSRVYDQDAYRWSDQAWTGRALPGAVIYELHIGTFTAGGTFDTAIPRLDHLVELGIDLVEVLPVNGFNGVRNWGYDGVAWYTVHEPYGGPDGLKRFVEACHARGLGVVLDVVYNHLGPSGNYLPRFGPYLKSGHNTWGELINLDGPDSDPVRRYIIDNALMWLRDYHIDGLRLDAVHALADDRAIHILEELAGEVDALATQLGRPLSLIAESDLNDPRLVGPRAAGGYGLAAAWDDDVHHALHVLLTGETHGYYADFAAPDAVRRVLTEAYFHANTWSSFRRRHHGRPVDRRRTPGHRFVAFLSDHDQVGNRALGDRACANLSPGRRRIGAALLLTSPFTPMLFMGQEWAACTPWQFFTSHPEPELAATVAAGRRAEFAEHGWPPGDVPDPQDEATFRHSILDWSEPAEPDHAATLSFYRRLVALRRSVPELADPRLDRIRVDYGEDWLTVHRGRYRVAVNLSDQRRTVPLAGTPVRLVLASTPGFVYARHEIQLPAESVAIVACLPPSA